MLFEMRHLYFGMGPIVFKEDSPPKWLRSEMYDWWFKAYVLTLPVGGVAKTDFNEIKRIE